jgi:hypothetical protein
MQLWDDAEKMEPRLSRANMWYDLIQLFFCAAIRKALKNYYNIYKISPENIQFLYNNLSILEDKFLYENDLDWKSWGKYLKYRPATTYRIQNQRER